MADTDLALPSRVFSREDFLYPPLSPNRTGRLKLDSLHTHVLGRVRQSTRRAGGVPSRRTGRRQRAGSSALLRPGVLSHHRLRPARRGASRLRWASSPTTPRRISSPISSACARILASSAGWCSADRGARRSRSPTPKRIPIACEDWCCAAFSVPPAGDPVVPLRACGLSSRKPWRAFAGFLPEAERGDLLAGYYRRLIDPDPAVHMPAAHAWSRYEGLVLDPAAAIRSWSRTSTRTPSRSPSPASRRTTSCTIFSCPSNALLAGVERIRHLPCVIVQGATTPCARSFRPTSCTWRGPRRGTSSSPTPGHSAREPGIARELVAATDRFRGNRRHTMSVAVPRAAPE